MTSRAQCAGDHGRVVADGAENPDTRDDGLVACALPLQRFAHHLHAVLVGRGFERRGMAALLQLEELAPRADELFTELLGRHLLRTRYHVRAVVVRPVEI